MIQPQELRIGNYVEYRIQDELDDRKEWWELSTIDSTDLQILESGIDDDYRAIELTEEILLKFGFEIEDEEENILVLKIPSELGYAELKYENNELYLYDGDRAKIGIKIEYAHRLQNFYYELKGEELTFK